MIFSTRQLLALAALAPAVSVAASTQSLASFCKTATIKAALPYDAVLGATIDTSSLIVDKVTNYNISSDTSLVQSASGLDFCDVTFSYSHDGRNDSVEVNYFLPAPADFQNRYLSTGGGGLAINSGSSGPQDALNFGAVGGRTDGGFGSFDNDFNLDGVDLLANGTLNYAEVYMLGYQAHRELSLFGKVLAKQAYSTGEKLYAYYEGCSEGGREGWSQVQRYGDEWDGALIGAPALRWAQQQVNHAFSAVAEQTVGHVPAPCALEAIVSATIDACDKLDGREDGVISRVDLCTLHYNVSEAVGTNYSCEASMGTPAQRGQVSKADVELVQTLYDGLRDSEGRRAYFYFTPGSSFGDASPSSYTNNSDGSIAWDVATMGLSTAQPTITRLIEKLMTDDLVPALTNLTYDALVQYMQRGMQEFYDSLQTTWPDLTPFNNAGGKVIHYHGESDNSIPAYSSVRYWNSVRSTMYPDASYNSSVDALGDWYRFFLVPGAAHCSPSTTQPNGPFPNNTLSVLIDWVKKDKKPVTLSAKVPDTSSYNGSQALCAFPLRPTWSEEGVMSCEYDQKSIDTWTFDLDAYKFPVY